jgi:hypothetical protein
MRRKFQIYWKNYENYKEKRQNLYKITIGLIRQLGQKIWKYDRADNIRHKKILKNITNTCDKHDETDKKENYNKCYNYDKYSEYDEDCIIYIYIYMCVCVTKITMVACRLW